MDLAAADEPVRQFINRRKVKPVDPCVPGIDRVEAAYVVDRVEPDALVADCLAKSIVCTRGSIVIDPLGQRWITPVQPCRGKDEPYAPRERPGSAN